MNRFSIQPLSFSRLLGFVALVAATAPGCAPPTSGVDPTQMLASDWIVGMPAPIPAGAIPQPGPTTAPLPAVGDSCSGQGGICLALKYVSYRTPGGSAVSSRDAAILNVRSINAVWAQCGIAFQIEQYVEADPAPLGLNYYTESFDELDRVRAAFADNGELLVVTTGEWDRSGTLGNSPANAWTTMPGSGVHGVVLEQPVADFPNIIGHELGHYLSLLHVNDHQDLMNPVIYSGSMNLTSDQCQSVRQAAAFFWPRMYR